jgi:hypothetical protein
VTRSLILSRVLAIFLIAGLMTAPLSAVAAMSAMTASMSMQGDDMPCCPEKSSPVDCDKCVLMAICMSKTFVAHPADVLAPLFASKTRTLIPASDPETDGLGYSPPPRPPRSSVLSA